MKKGIGILTAFVLSISLSCLGNDRLEENNMNSAAFNQLMDEVKKDDKQTVIWDGTNGMIADASDQNVDDGPNGFFPIQNINSDEWSVNVPYEWTVEIKDDNSADFLSTDRMFYLKKTEYEKEEQHLGENDQYEEITENALMNMLATKFQNAQLYRGILQSKEDSNMAGYILIVRDYFENEWELCCGGIGDMSEIYGEAESIFSSFYTIIKEED